MQKFTFPTSKSAGFAANTAQAGTTVDLMVRGGFTSFDIEYMKYIDQISNLFLAKTGIPIERIQNFLILDHGTSTDDVYIDVPMEGTVKLKEGLSKKKGEVVYLSEIDEVGEINFSNIEITPNDAIIHGGRIGWRSYLYFDFRRNLDTDLLYKILGKLRHDTIFKEIVLKADTSILETNYPLIITEGKTDWKHLMNAHASLGNDLRISFHKFEDDRGDSDILRMCEHYSRMSQQTKMIFVFDRDNPKILSELREKTQGEDRFQNWGNNVFSMFLPMPSHRERYNNVSIEFFYKDEDVRRSDTKGRRLHFTNELRKEINPDNSLRFVEIEPDDSIEFTKKIADRDAHKIENSTGDKTGISKSVFADYVLNRETGFVDLDLDEFEKVFDVIREIVELEQSEG